MPRKKKEPAPSPADDYFSGAASSWVSTFMRAHNGFNPVGFQRCINEQRFLIAPKGGAGLVPIKPNRQQLEMQNRVIENRKAGRPTRIILIKPRQGMGATTGVAAIFSGEAFANKAVRMKVSAIQPETIDDIWETYRIMFSSYTGKLTADGGYKDDAEKKKGERENDRFIRNPDTLSRVAIVNAATKRGANLGRGGSILHWHASEADYYPDMRKAMNSIMPSMDSGPLSIAILETTMNMEASTYFKDFVRRNLERKDNPDASHEGLWDVWFVSWFEVDYFRRPCPTPPANLSQAEQELLTLGATYENIAWRRYELNNQFGGNERAFTEAYPATLKEALSVWGVSDFFFTDAEDWYRSRTIKPPKARFTMDSSAREPMRELTDERDFKLCPHMELWSEPTSGHEYIVAADCADSEGRLTTIGSHNYAVVLDIATGEQVAEYEANCPVYLFSQALAQMGLYYNTALIAPESNYDGRAVVDFLNVRFNYPNLYRREVTDGLVLRDTEQFGFKTTSGTRQLLIDRLRFAFNTRRLIIRSERLLNQVVEFGHRGGAKIETSGKERGLLDDGVIALGIACAVHDLTSKWKPHTLEQLMAEPPKLSKSQKTLAKRNALCYTIDASEFDAAGDGNERLRRELNRT